LYRGVPTATSGYTDRVTAGITSHCDARACLAALQGGQAGAYPIKTRTDQQALFG